MIPDFPKYPFIPFQFNIRCRRHGPDRRRVRRPATQTGRTGAAECHLGRSECQRQPVVRGDQNTWETMIGGAEIGRAAARRRDPAVDGQPDCRQRHVYVKCRHTPAGPAGNAVLSSYTLSDFFAKIHQWYGDTPNQMAPLAGTYNANPLPALANFADYNLNAAAPTTFENFRVYVPWIPFEERGSGCRPTIRSSASILTPSRRSVRSTWRSS